MKNAYIFDFDYTLVITNNKLYIIKNDKRIKVLDRNTSKNYKLKSGETFDFSEFTNPYFIEKAKPYLMFNTLLKLDLNISLNVENIDIYILTARDESCKIPIHKYFYRHGIKNLPKNHIFTIGDNKGEINVPYEKGLILKKLKNIIQ